jgi:hypothetical protein
MAEILEHGIVKIPCIVDGDLLWNSIMTDDVLPKEFLDGDGGYIGNGLRFNPFGEVLHCDDSESVVYLCWCKFIDYVNAPPLHGPRWSSQLQRLCGSFGVMGEFLTSFTD